MYALGSFKCFTKSVGAKLVHTGGVLKLLFVAIVPARGGLAEARKK